ncbi:hypothetical protein COW36_03785 [bacterium (Candidatus Blackallbacteria) CG17_big_fil_post_rev_8_21_14_2_50_48_46]|uniref:Uncharacterized protein n=1 Tax=bacterium (Candidatus Blackallbacteria) CG17_big_fil_post_rev_8_21_14_2_50_48_46 TaxID=2014261 RepID=A0A2M7G8Q1_9BACT|nr:MAG: hypothetical protein COW64_05160 [bacterium (Candidatus Blackallbacteria) CG18_big_fil_WC_8_21_14_2_50_49_26]PIW18421.1 MAG: hypothetical protein COW36_03785 [bacterium (Candidatus Blackallbacteria) CG17_big_fil_post_rev_8_21_14_2_50_48_46]PIW46594.1 MAG: hypothetical protein COW20_16895 [bacterium (Candidatus Blackallbacteria) CG13_big_fil_rev_8_21_14_2_50_49_14]
MSQISKNERHELEIEEVEKDKLSSRVRKVRSQGKPLENFEQVVEKAQEIARKVSYLDEDLRLVEQDQAHEVVTLRSDEPQTAPGELEYYQVEVSKDGATQLERKRYKSEETETENVDFVISEKNLERLGKDLKGK